ncbi:zinc finger protein 418-like [Microplitis mediator]|uniref:zinc finger protein 418-like n=1 Tax=Microplitis mediator TaxID=375433 RepID=UPI002556707B|nr:zinc finger protein 418-like [Microplitis mediator]
MGHTQLLDDGFEIDLLTEDNYDTWKIKVEDYLTKTDLWKYVDGDFSSKPLRNKENDLAVWERKNNYAKSTITLFITESILKKVHLDPNLSAISKNLLYDLLNREEYKSIDNDRGTKYLFSEPFNQNENNLSHTNEDNRKYLQSLLKGDKKTTSDEPKRRYTCSVCGRDGHNKRTCQLKSSSAAESSANLTTPSKRTYKCGVCGDEGHNKTTCPQNSSKSTPASTSTSSEIPKRTYTCGNCGKSGHNRTTCPENKPVAIATSTPKRTYTCGNCGKEGHNRTSCPQNIPITTFSLNSTGRNYSCGLCGGQGHNRTTCALNNVLSSSTRGVSPNEYSGSSSIQRLLSSSSDSGGRSYSCGLCGGQGHNRRTCSLNNSSPTPSFSSFSPRPSSSLSSSGSGGRSYSCGLCGGQGHNRRTCSYR